MASSIRSRTNERARIEVEGSSGKGPRALYKPERSAVTMKERRGLRDLKSASFYSGPN